jgi:hypothetical protein
MSLLFNLLQYFFLSLYILCVEIKNFTGRVIALYLNKDWVTYLPDGHAKLNEIIKTDSDEIIDIKTYSLIGIDNLPHKENNILIVVDKEVAIQAWRDLRDDVVYMHCPLVKDDKHNSLASFSLVKWKNSYVRMNCT